MAQTGPSELESARLVIQDELDSCKSQAERNRLGQFATPGALAEAMILTAARLLPSGSPVRFLDPAFGTGSFYSALIRTLSQERIQQAVGFEIDPHYGRPAANLWRHTDLKLHLADFLREPFPRDDKKATLLICNPPYVRHHHLSTDDKNRLRNLAVSSSDTHLSGLAGLYAYFLLISHRWMAPTAVAAWLLPSEWMDVNYGKSLRQYLVNRVTLLRVHRCDPHDVQFGDALVSSAIVWFANEVPSENRRTVEFSFGGTIENPANSTRVKAQDLRKSSKWTRFSESEAAFDPDHGSHVLSDFFHIRRGLATGANRFFILDDKQVRDYRIPRAMMRPILPAPRLLTNDRIEADEHGVPRIDSRRWLIDCALPERQIRAEHPDLWKYLQMGVDSGIDQRYLCKNRRPWYSQETRPAAPILCTYMARALDADARPFRFILNLSDATATNVYLMLYPRMHVWRAMCEESSYITRLWEVLRAIPISQLLAEGRVYGGGLYKLEPRELANVSAIGLARLVPEIEESKASQLVMFERSREYRYSGIDRQGVSADRGT